MLGYTAWALEVQGRPKTARLATAEQYLALVGLSGFKNAYPDELSGGMKQRVALAFILMFASETIGSSIASDWAT